MEPTTVLAVEQLQRLPDHTELPDQDGSIVNNFQESPQTQLLTECLRPRLDELHPDGQYCIGADSGIYWRLTQPYLDGCKAPDWFYVPGVPPMLEGKIRRSYVLWQEAVRPLLVIEYVSGNGSEEHDATPYKGKFWVYEQAIAAAYYVIFDANKHAIEVHRLEAGRYHQMTPNASGRYPIEPLGIEFGIWEGTYQQYEAPWVRAWDSHSGELLPTATLRADAAEALVDDVNQMLQEECERAENERRRADEMTKAAKEQKDRADRLAEKLRALGIDLND